MITATAKFVVLWIIQGIIVYGLQDSNGTLVSAIIGGCFLTFNTLLTLWWARHETRQRRRRRPHRQHPPSSRSTDTNSEVLGKRKQSRPPTNGD